MRQKAEAPLHVRGNAIHADPHRGTLHRHRPAADKLDRSVLKHKEKKADKHAAEARRAREVNGSE